MTGEKQVQKQVKKREKDERCKKKVEVKTVNKRCLPAAGGLAPRQHDSAGSRVASMTCLQVASMTGLHVEL